MVTARSSLAGCARLGLEENSLWRGLSKSYILGISLHAVVEYQAMASR